MSDRLYILYDSRACGGDTEDASVLTVCESDGEARNEHGGLWGAVACYSYAHDGNKLVDERLEWNWFPKEEKRRSKTR